MERFVIIGNGKMAIDCLKLLLDSNIGTVVMVVFDSHKETPQSSIGNLCAEEGIPCRDSSDINDPSLVEEIGEAKPDLIFNINSYMIIKDALLAVPSVGIINFHNGPLPRYGGVNVCSWAILNGETQYGISWMLIDQGVDTGDILVQSLFDISDKELAITLIMRCIVEGVRTFPNLLEQIRAGKFERRSQDRTQASYFSRRDIPYDGRFPFWLSYDLLDPYVRALALAPMENNFFLPSVNIGGKDYFVDRLSLSKRLEGVVEVGRILSLDKNGLSISCQDSIVIIHELLDSNKSPVDLSDFLSNHGVVLGVTCFKE